jgi:hypothetical protein
LVNKANEKDERKIKPTFSHGNKKNEKRGKLKKKPPKKKPDI